MTENNTTPSDVLDPLDQNCDDVDLSFPILPGANYEMVCVEASVEPNKKKQADASQDGAGDNLVTVWETTKEEKTEKGEIVPAGRISLKQYTGITPYKSYTDENGKKKKDYTADDVKKQIAFFTRAMKKTGITARQVITNPEILVGGVAIRKVGVRKESGNFPRSNELNGFVIEG